MRFIAVALALAALLAGCARHQSSAPTGTSGAYAGERNRAGYGLHIGLGGYVMDSGVWD